MNLQNRTKTEKTQTHKPKTQKAKARKTHKMKTQKTKMQKSKIQKTKTIRGASLGDLEKKSENRASIHHSVQLGPSLGTTIFILFDSFGLLCEKVSQNVRNKLLGSILGQVLEFARNMY